MIIPASNNIIRDRYVLMHCFIDSRHVGEPNKTVTVLNLDNHHGCWSLNKYRTFHYEAAMLLLMSRVV